MSKIFYDYLISFQDLESEIKKATGTAEEREELWKIIDEIVHHRVLGCIFDKLPGEYHDEFLNRFRESPFDEGIFNYINDKLDVEESIEKAILKEVDKLRRELLEEVVR